MQYKKKNIKIKYGANIESQAINKCRKYASYRVSGEIVIVINQEYQTA